MYFGYLYHRDTVFYYVICVYLSPSKFGITRMYQTYEENNIRIYIIIITLILTCILLD